MTQGGATVELRARPQMQAVLKLYAIVDLWMEFSGGGWTLVVRVFKENFTNNPFIQMFTCNDFLILSKQPILSQTAAYVAFVTSALLTALAFYTSILFFISFIYLF